MLLKRMGHPRESKLLQVDGHYLKILSTDLSTVDDVDSPEPGY
uniref:Uncharacterized protein n=1 Tax=Physcomitrium patens TaxID=3218 RepID=A0A2K1INZ8_PHYPA|nr:hypothetical protein PHYPA_027318 [Physcomitrium patens]